MTKGNSATNPLWLIATSLNRLAKVYCSQNPPRWEYPLEHYSTFNWEAIEAKVIERDGDGVSKVLWFGHVYVRRPGNPKFAPAIWFSRNPGNSSDYLWLVAFKDPPEALPLDEKIRRRLRNPSR